MRGGKQMRKMIEETMRGETVRGETVRGEI